MASRHLRPHKKATNGIAERAIRHVREGTGASLVQAGMDPIWWGEACQCYCFLRVTRDLLHPDGKTSFERRYDRPFTGPLVPFGAKVYFLPTNKDDCKLLHLWVARRCLASLLATISRLVANGQAMFMSSLSCRLRGIIRRSRTAGASRLPT